MDDDDLLRAHGGLSVPIHHRAQPNRQHRVPMRDHRVWKSELRVRAPPPSSGPANPTRILCVITPESFPAPVRGAGNGIAYSLQFLGMVVAP